MTESLISAFIVLAVSLLFWALMDIAYSLYKNPNTKTRWVFLVLFFPVGGPLYYFRVIKKAQTENQKLNSSFSKIRA